MQCFDLRGISVCFLLHTPSRRDYGVEGSSRIAEAVHLAVRMHMLASSSKFKREKSACVEVCKASIRIELCRSVSTCRLSTTLFGDAGVQRKERLRVLLPVPSIDYLIFSTCHTDCASLKSKILTARDVPDTIHTHLHYSNTQYHF